MTCREIAYVPRRGWRLAYIALGSNQGDRWRYMAAGVSAIAGLPRSRILRRSSVLETDPVGPAGQGRYLNAVVELETGLTARELLDGMLAAERAAGRVRSAAERWGPRTLDLDLLLYGDETIREPELTTPHPRMAERRFVLEPLAQLAPDTLIPGRGVTVRQALRALQEAP
ncbi:MAG: 2-amino-4-hydroxy-6-hydroxymethyldihydropteridine diphosphokinase [Phycisphaerales bacterium JB039]